jgi:hypothetical protein
MIWRGRLAGIFFQGNHQDVSGGIDLRTGAIALKLMVLVIDVDDFMSRVLSRRPCGIGSKSNREMVGLDVDPGDIGWYQVFVVQLRFLRHMVAFAGSGPHLLTDPRDDQLLNLDCRDAIDFGGFGCVALI